MKNIELKISLGNRDNKIENKIKGIRAKYVTRMHQVDTYFNFEKARLKTREINNKNFELICYLRPNKKESKISNYKVIPIDKKVFGKIKYILTSFLGVKITIKKVRELWLFDNTRVHLDHVNGLGDFLELETVVNGSLTKAQTEHKTVIKKLGLNNFKKINKSYPDLRIEAGSSSKSPEVRLIG